MYQYQGYQQDEGDNENQQPSQQQGYDDEGDQDQWGQTWQQHRGDQDNNEINEEGDYGTEYANNAVSGEQPQDDGETASQLSDKEGDAENNVQDNDNRDDGQKAPESSDLNINFNVNLAGDLENSDLHEGGIIFSKKLLAQLFSGPGEHDPQEEEVPMHQIEHEHADTAASGEWTIVELKTQDAKGATIYLKAKLDSGADDNFMSADICEVTGLDIMFYEGPEGPPAFTMGGGQQSQPLGTIRLEYTAGIKPQKFIETFQVLNGLPHDVIIGKPLMTRAHMMMVNPNFANPPGHPALCLMELPPKNKDSKAKALELQKQRAKEQAAAYKAKLQAQEAAAPKSELGNLFGKQETAEPKSELGNLFGKQETAEPKSGFRNLFGKHEAATPISGIRRLFGKH